MQGYPNGSVGSSGTYRQTSPHYFLGDLISGTYCSRIFSDCDRNECRLQSPNFPGMYPRNLTCYYAIRQQSIPPNKHALISIRQKNGQLLSIQSIQYAENKHETKLKVFRLLLFLFSAHLNTCRYVFVQVTRSFQDSGKNVSFGGFFNCYCHCITSSEHPPRIGLFKIIEFKHHN